jgi:predicted O-methyltransferase YrrM
MANRTLPMNDALHAYLVKVSVREPAVMRALRDETAKLPQSGMQIGPEQGAFMGWLAGTLGVTRAIEIGTFTGYSALAVAGAMPAHGRLIACDVSEEFTNIARRYWKEAGLAERIELHLGPAIDTLASLIASSRGTYDFAFIDADKVNYDRYYEACLELLRVGGIIVVDNVLWSGKVLDGSVTDADTAALRALNDKIGNDERVDACMLPLGDGLTLARKL